MKHHMRRAVAALAVGVVVTISAGVPASAANQGSKTCGGAYKVVTRSYGGGGHYHEQNGKTWTTETNESISVYRYHSFGYASADWYVTVYPWQISSKHGAICAN